MKKKLYAFNKKNKKGDSNKPRNEITYSSGKELYKSFNFDSDCSQSYNNSLEITILSDKIKECDLKKEIQYAKNQDIVVSHDKPVKNIIESLAELECLFEGQSNNNFVEYSPPKKISQSHKTSFEPLKSLNSSKQTNFKSNTHFIKISDSKNFHIGTKQNIFFGENSFEFLRENNLKETRFNNLDIQTKDMKELLDCEDKISEPIIELVAMNLVNADCKLFGKSLGLEDHLLDDIAERNDSKISMTYDILQSFVQCYPNTSLGFVVSILYSHCEMGVIKSISENKKEFTIPK